MREQSTQRRKRGGTNPQERDHVKGEKQGGMELNTKLDGGSEGGLLMKGLSVLHFLTLIAPEALLQELYSPKTI